MTTSPAGSSGSVAGQQPRRGHPDHLVGRGDAHAENAVKPVEHHEHVVARAEFEAGDAVDEPVGDSPGNHRVVVTRLVELPGHTRQVIVADKDVLTAVEVGEVGHVVCGTRRHRDVVEGVDDDLDLAPDSLAASGLVRVTRLFVRAGHGELPPVSASMSEMSLAYPQSESVRGRMDVTELKGPDLSVPPEELPALALSRPRIALALARSHAVPGADPWTLSFALQAAGIVLRDAGETTAAIVELRQAVRAAEATGDVARVADVRATLGAALVKAGRTQAGLRHLDAAADASHGDALARVRLRRAHVLAGLGRHEAALEDLRRAVAAFRAGGDRLWEARALSNRSEIHVARGSLARAERDARRAETLFRAAGQELEATYALHNRGIVTYCQGDIPGALGDLRRGRPALHRPWV